jgi:hypothetical protein
MGIWLPGYPPTDVASPFNDPDGVTAQPLAGGRACFGRVGSPPQIPTARPYNFVLESTGTYRSNQSFRFDERSWSPVYWEYLSLNNPRMPKCRETPVILGTGCQIMQNAVSITNAFQWLPINHTVGANDGVELDGVIMYHADNSNCYRCVDITQHQNAVWTTQGAMGWAADTGVLRNVAIIKSGSRLIAVRQSTIGPGSKNLDDELEIRVSDDEGVTWTRKKWQRFFDRYTSVLRIQLTGANTLVVVEEEDYGTVPSPPAALFVRYDTSDNGDTWTRTTGSAALPFDGFLYITSGTYLASAGNHIYRSTDQGATWTDVYSEYRVGKYFNEDFTVYTGEINGFSMASDGTLKYLYSDDDGQTWTESTVTTNGSNEIHGSGDLTPHIYKGKYF